jgi:hypothetical protein
MAAAMQLNVDWDRSAGVRDPLFYGYFLEHFHRQVYGGVYDPGPRCPTRVASAGTSWRRSGGCGRQ